MFTPKPIQDYESRIDQFLESYVFWLKSYRNSVKLYKRGRELLSVVPLGKEKESLENSLVFIKEKRKQYCNETQLAKRALKYLYEQKQVCLTAIKRKEPLDISEKPTPHFPKISPEKAETFFQHLVRYGFSENDACEIIESPDPMGKFLETRIKQLEKLYSR